jgi:predicted ATPase
MARTAGIQRSDTPDERLAKLETLVIPGVDPREALPLMGFLCGVPTDHRYPRLDLPPEQRKRAVLSMFNRQLDALCAAGPVLMLVEDAHWIDPSSSELLAHTISRISELPLLIVISHRTGEEPDWLKEVDGTRMQLQRLDQAGAEAVISQVAGGPLPPALQAQILEKSNGVPLFVEEITK